MRYKKPVGIYWLQAAAVETASSLGLPRAQIRIWLYRVPSLIGAIGAVLLTYWTALAFITRRSAVLAGLIICSSVLLGVESRLAKTDAMLLLTIVAAMGALARIYLSCQRRENPAASALDTSGDFLDRAGWRNLAQGSVNPDVRGIDDRDRRYIRSLRIMAVAAAARLGADVDAGLVMPWFVAIFFRAGDTFFADSIGGDMLSKFAAQESHGAPPGTYLLLFWITFWPGAPLAGLAAPAVWRARQEPGVQFLLAWLVPSWIVFELVLTKLPHYVLPLYPAIAILSVTRLSATCCPDHG